MDGETGKGCPSWKGICFIRLDSKARLVLPLEIRDAIGIKTGDKILFSASATEKGGVVVKLAKAPDNLESCACSRNAGYVKKKQLGCKK
jgi:bifunctional DNA-binding transcriptional regulator/antitoxin component of YhaV-PrlF toxin-antitoxin module